MCSYRCDGSTHVASGSRVISGILIHASRALIMVRAGQVWSECGQLAIPDSRTWTQTATVEPPATSARSRPYPSGSTRNAPACRVASLMLNGTVARTPATRSHHHGLSTNDNATNTIKNSGVLASATHDVTSR